MTCDVRVPWHLWTFLASRDHPQMSNIEEVSISARSYERGIMTATRARLLKRLEAEALQIRRNVWRALHAAGSGHVGGSASAAELLAALSFHCMQVRRHETDGLGRDRFVISNR